MSKFFSIRDMKMHKKLLISYLIVVIIPVSIIGSFLIKNTKDIVLAHINQTNEITLRQMDNNISNVFRSYFKIADDILTEAHLIDMLSREYRSESDYLRAYSDVISDSMARLQLKMPHSVRILFFTTNHTIVPDGNMLFYADENVASQDWYRDAIEAKGSKVVSLPYIDHTGNKVFSISRVLLSTANSRRDTVLKLEISLKDIDDLIMEEGKNKKVYLLDGSNHIFTLAADDILNDAYEIGDVLNIECPQKRKIFSGNVCMKLEEALDVNGNLEGWKVVSVISPDFIIGDINKTVMHSIIICLITIGITIIFLFIFSYKMTRRLRILTDSMNRIMKDNTFDADTLKTYSDNDEIGELSRRFKQLLEWLDRLISEVYISEIRLKDLELEKRKAEIKALQSQINPHFLFNTMESISMSLLTKGDYETCEVVRSFSNILRRSIEWDDDLYPLENELHLILDYLKVQKFRYKDKLSYEIAVDERFYHVLIPRFILQPIVENSIYHGLELKEDTGFLKIATRTCGDDLELTVEDNGLGIGKHRLKAIQSSIKNAENIIINSDEHESIGLSNINRRLVLYYGREYGITIDSLKNVGTKVVVRIPMQIDEGEDSYV